MDSGTSSTRCREAGHPGPTDDSDTECHLAQRLAVRALENGAVPQRYPDENQEHGPPGAERTSHSYPHDEHEDEDGDHVDDLCSDSCTDNVRVARGGGSTRAALEGLSPAHGERSFQPTVQ